MKEPGPDHPITITRNPHRIRVMLGGFIVAETTQALTLQEATLPAVQYIPREDVQMDLLDSTDHHTHCPYKGDASYFTVNGGGLVRENAAWSYENSVSRGRGHQGACGLLSGEGRRHRGVQRLGPSPKGVRDAGCRSAMRGAISGAKAPHLGKPHVAVHLQHRSFPHRRLRQHRAPRRDRGAAARRRGWLWSPMPVS